MSCFSFCPHSGGKFFHLRNLYALIAFYLYLFCLPAGSGAALSGKTGDVLPGVPETDAAGKAAATVAEMPKTEKEAMTALSGSQWPGIIDHLLQRPLPDAPEQSPAEIHINYPSVGDRLVDGDIRAWVEGLADAFEAHLDLEALSYAPPEPEDDMFLHDDDLNSPFAAIEDAPRKFELWGDYKISRPSDAALSITFEIWNYTNPEQGNLDILTLNYNLHNGQRLNLVDIFEKPDVALALMSEWSRRQLEPRLGALRRAAMLKDGTEPLMENFSSITLTPEGVRINFQPYQVAPADAGIQKVDMPLEELLPSAPLLALWGKTGTISDG